MRSQRLFLKAKAKDEPRPKDAKRRDPVCVKTGQLKFKFSAATLKASSTGKPTNPGAEGVRRALTRNQGGLGPMFHLVQGFAGEGELSQVILEKAVLALATSFELKQTVKGSFVFKPPTECLASLAEAYFKYANVHQPIVDKEDFFRILTLDSPALPQQTLVTCVCLSGLNYHKHVTTVNELKGHLTSRLLFLFKKIYLMPCLSSVQAFLLASHWHFSDSKGPLASKSCSYYQIACRMAKTLGLDSCHLKKGNGNQGLQKVIWSSIYNTGVFYYFTGYIPFNLTCQPESLPKTDFSSSFNEQGNLYFESFTMFLGMLEEYNGLKINFKLVSKRFTSFGKLDCETTNFFGALREIEGRVLSWYLSLPSFLRSKSKTGFLSTPSLRNPFSCRIHIVLFYILLDINSLRIAPMDWELTSFNCILRNTGKLPTSISIDSFLHLTPLEKSVLSSHLVASVFGASANRSAVFNGNAINWIFTFRVALFLNKFSKRYSKKLNHSEDYITIRRFRIFCQSLEMIK